MGKYKFHTSPDAVADVVLAVARSPSSTPYFVAGHGLDAANEAVALGLLRCLGDGKFELSLPVPHLQVAKDPGGWLLTYADLREMGKERGDDFFIKGT